MESYSIIQQYALIGLDGTDSKNKSVEKTAVLRAIAAGRFVEKLMESGGHQKADFQEKLEQGIKEARALGTRELKEVEKEIAAPLKADGALEEAPDLLGCDMYYETSGADLKVYRSDKEIYLRITEMLRCEALEEGALTEESVLLLCDMYYETSGADLKVYRSDKEIYLRITEMLRCEALEEGALTEESVLLLWLIRESGFMHEIFSAREQGEVEQKMVAEAARQTWIGILWGKEFHKTFESLGKAFIRKKRELFRNPYMEGVNILYPFLDRRGKEFHKTFESLGKAFIRKKRELFRNPYMEGVNILYPFLDRRQAIFIDFVVLGTTVVDRRGTVMSYLCEHGHFAEEIKNGTETLLKIDNIQYRIVPKTVRCGNLPIQGAVLSPVYR